MRWDTKIEKSIIRKLGGKPLTKYGTDGVINGKPVEVRAVKKDTRLRIQKNVHEELVRKGGSYIIVDAKHHKVKKILAKKVSKMLKKGKWYKDRKYPHKFLSILEVFE